jgi:heme a synthase
MGIGTQAVPRTAASPGGRGHWLVWWTRSPVALRRLALASIAANVVIVVTGGAVRLTDSGLGCPTFPTCTGSSLVPTGALGVHGAIEFANRQLTFVLAAIAVATWVAAMAQRRERRLATVAALGIPAQAVLGGLTVLTHLNPWLVALHFLLSMSIIAVTMCLWWRLRGTEAETVAPAARNLAGLVLLATAATLAIGTVVTGSGPHAGDTDSSGKVHRIALQVSSMAQLHADAVMVLIGLTVGLLAVAYAVRAGAPVRQAAWVLLGVELGQGVIGFTQYFLDVPPVLVALHMLGACLVWLAALRIVLLVSPWAIPISATRPVKAAG